MSKNGYELRMECLSIAERISKGGEIDTILEDAKSLYSFVEGRSSFTPKKNVKKEEVLLENCLDDLPYEHPIHGKSKLKPYDFQKHLVEYLDMDCYPRIIINAARQMGTTMTICGYLNYLANKKVSHIGIKTSTSNGDKEILNRIKMFNKNILSVGSSGIDFKNGSTIEILKYNTDYISKDVIWLSDLSHFKDTPTMDIFEWDKKWIITGCPNKDDDLFAKLWHKEAEGTHDVWLKFKLNWRKHPHHDEKWEREQRERLGDRFELEYNNKFPGEIGEK